MGFKYKAFISYNHKDSAWAEWLLRKLEAYRIPKQLAGTSTQRGVIPARLAPIFRDRDELPAAESLSDRLNEALTASEYLIVIASPRAAKSRLVNKEIVEFKRIHGNKNILALIVDGEPFAADSDRECFPSALKQKSETSAASISFAAEGIAADVRTEGDGKRRSLLKIVAGMIGVGLDALVRREDRRRQRRMATALVASVAVTLITGGLAYEAHTAREAAEQAQLLAEANAREADKNAQTAKKRLKESLEISNFLMTTVYEELLGVGNLETLEIIVNKTLEPYLASSINTLSPAEFFEFTGNMMRLGQMLDRRGESGKARRIFEDALPRARSFYESHQQNAYTTFRLQNILFFVGYLALRQGRYEDAEAVYRERLELVKLGRKSYPQGSAFNHNGKLPYVWHYSVAEAESSLAALLYGAMGKPYEALKLAQSSLTERKALANKGADVLYGLGSSYQHLGDIYRATGQLSKAMQAFKDRLTLFETALTETSGGNFRLMRRRYTSLQNIGHIQMDRGEYALAVATYQEAANGFDILTAKDPANTLWLAGSTELHANLAAAYLDTGNIPNAKTALAKARKQSDETMKRDPSRVRRQATAHEIALLEAKITAAEGNTVDAAAQLQMLSRELDKAGDNFLRSNGVPALYGKTHIFLGRLLAEDGNSKGAREHWLQAAHTLEASPATLSLDAKDCLATAYRLLGQNNLATTLSTELEASGFTASVLTVTQQH